ncbi:MAG: type I 3-dehydroquinate dehydratase [Patescibacteria group bacterium]
MKKCVSIINPKDIEKANNTKADLLELRMDLYPDENLEKLIEKCQKPVIVKINGAPGFMPVGGQVATHWDKPGGFWIQYIDIDYRDSERANTYSRLFKNNKNNLIISYHNFQKTPDFKFLDKLVKTGVNKIAVKINKIEDNLVIAKLLKKYSHKIIAIGMGELGMMTRLNKRNMISYFALDKHKQSAPGQLTIDQADMKLYGIIGNPAQHSLSPKMHNLKFKKNKINALYQIWETENLKNMMQIFREFNLAGASVTTPFKEEVMKYLDVVDKVAKTIGAVNTIVNKKGKLYGYNTDWYGIVMAIINCKRIGRRKYVFAPLLHGKQAIILGNGGAAKAAKYGLEKYGAQVKMLSRKGLNNFTEKFNILINATPVFNKLLINKELINKNCLVMDMIYYKKTKLLQIARQKKAIAFNGLNMLKYQGELQYYYWHKKPEDYSNITL